MKKRQQSAADAAGGGGGCGRGEDAANAPGRMEAVVRAVASDSVCLVTTPLRCYTYDETVQRCSVLRRPPPTQLSDALAMVAEINLFGDEGDANW